MQRPNLMYRKVHGLVPISVKSMAANDLVNIFPCSEFIATRQKIKSMSHIIFWGYQRYEKGRTSVKKSKSGLEKWKIEEKRWSEKGLIFFFLRMGGMGSVGRVSSLLGHKIMKYCGVQLISQRWSWSLQNVISCHCQTWRVAATFCRGKEHVCDDKMYIGRCNIFSNKFTFVVANPLVRQLSTSQPQNCLQFLQP